MGRVKSNGFVPCRERKLKLGFFSFFFSFAMNFGNIPQTSDFRLQSSEFRLQTSDFRLQTSDFRLQSSEFRLQTSDFRLQTSDFRLQSSDFGLRTSDLCMIYLVVDTGIVIVFVFFQRKVLRETRH